MALLSLVAIPACAATMPAVTMKVVDEHDGTPIAGVTALFLETAREGTTTGHGGKSALLFAATRCMRKVLTILNAMMRTNTTWQQINRSETA